MYESTELLCIGVEPCRLDEPMINAIGGVMRSVFDIPVQTSFTSAVVDLLSPTVEDPYSKRRT